LIIFFNILILKIKKYRKNTTIKKFISIDFKKYSAREDYDSEYQAYQP